MMRIFEHMGKPGKRTEAMLAAEKEFCDDMISLWHSLGKDAEVGSRGWCYLLEDYGLLKPNFDSMESFITGARKDGRLPNDICIEDDNRGIELFEVTTDKTIEEYAEWIRTAVVKHHVDRYTPDSAWAWQEYFIIMAVEKKDLLWIFRPVCKKYRIPLVNFKGWTDIHSRANMLMQFQYHDDRGRKPVLLYCGDHDPAGLNISHTLPKNLDDVKNVWYARTEQEISINPADIILDRFGLNAGFIKENNISTVDNLLTGKKKAPNDLSDPRHPDHMKPYVQNYIEKFGAWKCEANALVTRVDAGRDMAEAAILKYLDANQLSGHESELKEVRDDLSELFT